MKMSMRKKVRSPIVLDDSSEEPRVEETDERRARALPGTGRGAKQRALRGDARVRKLLCGSVRAEHLSLWRMQSVSEMADFVSLWDVVQDIQLTDQPDQITWKWTANGEYTSKSAYSAQFLGSYRNFHGQYIWKAESEGKHKFFAWLLVQSI